MQPIKSINIFNGNDKIKKIPKEYIRVIKTTPDFNSYKIEKVTEENLNDN